MNRLVRVVCPSGRINCTDTTFISSEMRVVVHEKSKKLYRGTVTLAGDGSYLKFDTNPSDEEDGGYTDVWKEIAEANKMFGLPESINERMKTTNSMDGKVTETVDGIKVTWSYHPDRGLEVMYEKQ